MTAVQRAAGRSAGMSGLLSVNLARRDDGVTVISSLSSRAPLLLQRAMYTDAELPQLAHACIMSSSGGMLQGDFHKTRMSLESGAQASITTQGATRIYGMDSSSSGQEISMELGSDAYLEFLPGQIIPYRGSKYRQVTEAVVHSSATMLCSEVITPGRVAMGEMFVYDTCNVAMRTRDENGRLRLADVSHLEPQAQELEGIGVLDGRNVTGSVYLLADPVRAKRILGRIADVDLDRGVEFAASLLHASDGFTARLLGDHATDIIETVSAIARIVRDDVLVQSP